MLRIVTTLLLMVGLLSGAGAGAAVEAALPRLRDVIRVSLVEQSLQIDWLGPAQPPDRPMTVAGPEARWNVWSPRVLGAGVPGSLEIHRPIARTSTPEFFWIIGVSSSPQRLSMTGHRGGRAVYDTSVQFTQEASGVVQLVVSRRAARDFKSVRARDIVELRAAHPQLVRTFLVPLLRQLAGHDPLVPGATDVYRVFEQIEPDEQTVAIVGEVLPRLGHASYEVREQASQTLDALAPRAVAAVLHLQRDALMPEQQLRLEDYLARHSHRLIPDAHAAGRDLGFLADCLEFTGDDRVRWTAKREIERLTGRAIPMHHAPTDEEWSNAADVIRTRLSEASQK